MNFQNLRFYIMNKFINIVVVAVFMIFVIIILAVTTMCTGFQGLPVSSSAIVVSSRGIVSENKKQGLIFANTNQLSNKKIEWGIKRNINHEQPDLGETNKKLIEQYNGIAMGNGDSKNIYLTFDVGYEGGYTEHILDVLKENNVPAAFFVTGQFVKTNPELIQRMIDEGHIVGNHTVNHTSLPECNQEKLSNEIMNLHKAIYEKFNYEMKYMRPPKGEYSEQTLVYIQALGYKSVMWSFAYDDWDNNKQGREEYGKEKILSNTHNGEIMLLHATSKDNSNILDFILKEIKKQGYIFKNLNEFK